MAAAVADSGRIKSAGRTGVFYQQKIKKEQVKTQAINAAVLALLHDRLYQACQFYLKRGYCTVGDRDNLEYMFRPYKALGGNGTGEELYNRCLALTYEPEESEDRE